MLHNSSKRIASFLVSNNIITDEDASVYAYGLELILATIVNTFVVCVIGIVMGRFIETILFLASFAILRSFSGGYHASTHVKCLVILVVAYMINMVLIWMISVEYMLYASLVLQFISIFLIFKYAPVENENKPLNEEERRNYKIKSRILSLVLAAIASAGLLLFPTAQELFFSITLGLTTAAASTSAAVIKISK